MKFIVLALVVTVHLVLTSTSCKAASITTNIDDEACQGEEWILTCTGHSPSHRWSLETKGGRAIQMIYTGQSMPGTMHMESYNFTLTSATYNWFESSVSTVLTTTMNNTEAKCIDNESEETVTIKMADTPSSPHGLRISRVFRESGTNYSKLEVTWEPQQNGSRIDFYFYQIVNLRGISYEAITTNTTINISGIPYNTNISLVVSAGNCEGKSPPVTLFMNTGINGQISVNDSVWPIDTDNMGPLFTSSNAADYTMAVVEVMPPNGSKVLLISISTICGIIILSMSSIILCLIVVLKRVMEESPDGAMYSSENIYAELEPGSTYVSSYTRNQFEEIEDMPEAYERVSSSLSDGSQNVSHAPVYANATL